jgi:mRNA-binding protein PUF3
LLNHLEWGSEERRQFKAEVFAKMTLLKAANTKTLASVQKIFDEDKEREETERALLQVDVPSPTPELTNETNSPQSDSPPSADASAIEVSPTNPKNTEASLRVRDIDA